MGVRSKFKKIITHRALSERISKFLKVMDFNLVGQNYQSTQRLPCPQTLIDFGKDVWAWFLSIKVWLAMC